MKNKIDFKKVSRSSFLAIAFLQQCAIIYSFFAINIFGAVIIGSVSILYFWGWLQFMQKDD